MGVPLFPGKDVFICLINYQLCMLQQQRERVVNLRESRHLGSSCRAHDSPMTDVMNLLNLSHENSGCDLSLCLLPASSQHPPPHKHSAPSLEILLIFLQVWERDYFTSRFYWFRCLVSQCELRMWWGDRESAPERRNVGESRTRKLGCL